MKKITKILIILTILIIIVLGICIFVLKKKAVDYPDGPTDTVSPDSVEKTEEIIEEEKRAKEELNVMYDRVFYYSIKKVFKDYLSNVNMVNDSTIESVEEKKEFKNAIMGVLDKNYVSENKITIDNMKYNVDTKEKLAFEIVDWKKLQSSDVTSFAVYGMVTDLAYNFKGKVYFIINFDKINSTYSIEFVDDLSNIKNREIKEIEKNDYNSYLTEMISTDTTCRDYLDKYKRLSLAMPNVMYNMLDEEYRNTRFGSYENFEKYIKENKEKIYSTNLKQYKEFSKNGNTTYLCIDQNNKYYIINEKSHMDFKYYLDAYTVDVLNTSDKYVKASDDEKVNINMDKFILALNDKNYGYIYNVLEDKFKTEKFPTQDSLEKYLNKNFYEKNKINGRIYLSDIQNGYASTVNILNANNTKESKKVRIEMFLLDGLKYKIIFNVV